MAGKDETKGQEGSEQKPGSAGAAHGAASTSPGTPPGSGQITLDRQAFAEQLKAAEKRGHDGRQQEVDLLKGDNNRLAGELNVARETAKAADAKLLAHAQPKNAPAEPLKPPKFRLLAPAAGRTHVSSQDTIEDAIREFNGDGRNRVFARMELRVEKMTDSGKWELVPIDTRPTTPLMSLTAPLSY
jgi:hypothetical protein